MTNPDFDALCTTRIAAVLAMRDTKGREYAGGDADRLANFKRSAEHCGVSPLQSWLVLFDKHMGSIQNYVKSGGQTYSTESIQSRITDAITYLLLFEGLVADAGSGKVPGDAGKPHQGAAMAKFTKEEQNEYILRQFQDPTDSQGALNHPTSQESAYLEAKRAYREAKQALLDHLHAISQETTSLAAKLDDKNAVTGCNCSECCEARRRVASLIPSS